MRENQWSLPKYFTGDSVNHQKPPPLLTLLGRRLLCLSLFFQTTSAVFSCIGLDLHLNHSPELVSVKLNVRLKIWVSNCLLEIRCYTLTHVSANPTFGKLTRLLFVFAFASIMSLVCFLSLPNILISFFFFTGTQFSALALTALLIPNGNSPARFLRTCCSEFL